MKRKREDEFQCEKVKQRSTTKFGGDGLSWFRGPIIGKGSFGSVYQANLKRPRLRFGCFLAVMAMKSAEISVPITIGENGEMVYNLLLEFASGGTLADLIKKSGGASQNKKRKLDPYMRGTPMYLSPEVVTDCIQEPPSDIWAFGCIELEMVTGKPQWFHKQDMNAEALLCMIGEGLVDYDDDNNDEVEEGDESLVADEVDSWMILFESHE
ncbi:mitogen-activated protein kinase kinase kinase 21 [Actinidia rufa]|uniref:Mitogen-activated protein kinase kinase kinase 21 n=1 Tax=Actinidia rufa TaxID=165716 RepID=A0A7J0FZ84_9ERIC|nr:mitogen-activated protein kinase kinase kinase 21 [Actinidia rufa]